MKASAAFVCVGLLGSACSPMHEAESPTSPAPMQAATAHTIATQPSARATPAPAATTIAAPAPPAPAQGVAVREAGVDALSVSVGNPLALVRSHETIELTLAEIEKVSHGLDLKKALIVDAQGAPVLSQLVDTNGDESPDAIVFQSDFGPNETKSFRVQLGERRIPSRDDFKVYGRFVRERHDDFAWENELVAHRVYGPDLETCKKEPLTSSGVDTWVKRTTKLVVNEWYMTDDYHEDRGQGADFYSVGKSRGCGGLGIWTHGKLHVSRNFKTTRVLANGPIRLIFELEYAPWDTGAGQVAETRRITLDAGTHFNRVESTFKGAHGALPVAIGIAKHPDIALQTDPKSTWMATWEPLNHGQSGNLGCAIVLPPGSSATPQSTESDYLLVTPAPASGPLVYYAGSGWDRAGAVTSADAWVDEVQALSSRLGAPLKIELAAATHAP